MSISISPDLMSLVHKNGEKAYPDEGAGFLFGKDDGQERLVKGIFELPNQRQGEARRTRYLISAQDYLKAEMEAERVGLDVIGVFHSHPDHPNQASEYDREWAQPLFSYIITSIQGGKAVESRSWRLSEDRARFNEEKIISPERILNI